MKPEELEKYNNEGVVTSRNFIAPTFSIKRLSRTFQKFYENRHNRQDSENLQPSEIESFKHLLSINWLDNNETKELLKLCIEAEYVVKLILPRINSLIALREAKKELEQLLISIDNDENRITEISFKKNDKYSSHLSSPILVDSIITGVNSEMLKWEEQLQGVEIRLFQISSYIQHWYNNYKTTLNSLAKPESKIVNLNKNNAISKLKDVIIISLIQSIPNVLTNCPKRKRFSFVGRLLKEIGFMEDYFKKVNAITKDDSKKKKCRDKYRDEGRACIRRIGGFEV